MNTPKSLNGRRSLRQCIRRAVSHPNPWVMLVLGALLSVPGGWIFYEISKGEAVAEAREQGRLAGMAQGQRDAEAAFELRLPELLEERYGQAVETAREAGYGEGLQEGREQSRAEGERSGHDAGYREGLEQGLTSGYQDGYAQCRSDALEAGIVEEQAYRDWENYELKVRTLADWAATLQGEPSNSDRESFMADVAGLVVAAQTLQGAYADQAAAFNSTIDDMADALETGDVERVRSLIRTLQGSLDTKQERFLRGVKQAISAHSSLRPG